MRGSLGEGAQKHVGDAQAGFDIATGDSRGRNCVDDGAWRSGDGDGIHESGGGGGVFREQAAEHVKACGPGDWKDSVDGALHWVRGAGEVDGDGRLRGSDVDGDGEADGAALDAVAVR